MHYQKSRKIHWKILERKIKKLLYAIFQVIDESIFEKILEAKTTKET